MTRRRASQKGEKLGNAARDGRGGPESSDLRKGRTLSAVRDESASHSITGISASLGETETSPAAARAAANMNGEKDEAIVVSDPHGEPAGEAGEKKSNAVSRLLAQMRPNLAGRQAPRSVNMDTLQALRKKVLSKDVSEDVSEELSLLLGIAQKIHSRNIPVDQANDRLQFTVDSLLSDPPRLVLARDERLRLQVEIYHNAGIIGRMMAALSSGSSVGLVLIALIFSLGIWSTLVFGLDIMLKWLDADQKLHSVFFMNGETFLIIASGALVGGVVSIATRLHEFSRVRDLDPFAMFWTALLKPLIGVVLSVFIFAAWAGGVINFGFIANPDFEGRTFQELPGNTLYVLWAIGFLSGFSERFAWDFVGRAENTASGLGNSNGNGRR